MSDSIITIENLGKKYRLRHQRDERYTALRDVLTDRAKSLFRRRNGPSQPSTLNSQLAAPSSREDFWALRDVSFQVERGEVLGIIGRNGAGKTTLLKILSRITDPTEGKVRIKGRVASLLEVGTGFHPELTGRENIYLNGAILGMRRDEIKRKFDEIVGFAEVERFLDTPVKRYSTGMYVRLAFAVAAHLEPEILIVDEVLAVGDASFQKKCLGKMREVASEHGRTVLFVSHNTEAICALCSRCLLLEMGKLAALGDALEIVARYLGAQRTDATQIEFDQAFGQARFRWAGLYDPDGNPAGCFRVDEAVALKCQFEVESTLAGLEVSFAVLNFKGERLFYSTNAMADPEVSVESAGVHEVKAVIPAKLLLPGRYFLNLLLHRPNVQIFDFQEQMLWFEIVRTGGEYHGFPSSELGYVYADVTWQNCVGS